MRKLATGFLIVAISWVICVRPADVRAAITLPRSTPPALEAYPGPPATVVWPGQGTPDLTPQPLPCKALVAEHIATWGELGSEPGQIGRGAGVAYDPQRGLVYVLDSANYRVNVYNRNGRYLRGFGQLGDGPVQFIWPTGIAVGKDGSVLVGDNANQRVQAVSPWGVLRREWEARSPSHIDIGPQGNIFVHVHQGTDTAAVFTPDGSVLGYYRLEDDQDEGITSVGGIAATSANILYVRDNWKLRIVAFSLDGTYLTHWFYSTGQHSPDLVDLPGGQIIVLAGALRVFDRDGTDLGELSVPAGVVDIYVAGEDPMVLVTTDGETVSTYRLSWECPTPTPTSTSSPTPTATPTLTPTPTPTPTGTPTLARSQRVLLPFVVKP